MNKVIASGWVRNYYVSLQNTRKINKTELKKLWNLFVSFDKTNLCGDLEIEVRKSASWQHSSFSICNVSRAASSPVFFCKTLMTRLWCHHPIKCMEIPALRLDNWSSEHLIDHSIIFMRLLPVQLNSWRLVASVNDSQLQLLRLVFYLNPLTTF